MQANTCWAARVRASPVSGGPLGDTIVEMTSDGIEDADWASVHELAVEIVNCAMNDEPVDQARYVESLFTLLDQLERKYGPKPSLLATRADYVDSSESREVLLQAAYAEALRTQDSRNLTLVAHSLAEFYIGELQDTDRGAAWLRTWSDQLGESAAPEDRSELARLYVLLQGGAA